MRRAAEMLRELTEPMPRAIFDWNPIQVAERMTTTDDFAWNAFAYTYNNYAPRRLPAARAVCVLAISFLLSQTARDCRSVLGGTGIAHFHYCRNCEAALAYATFVASGTVQRTVYANVNRMDSLRTWQGDAWTDSTAGQRYAGILQGHAGNAGRKPLSARVTAVTFRCKPEAAKRCRNCSAMACALEAVVEKIGFTLS